MEIDAAEYQGKTKVAAAKQSGLVTVGYLVGGVLLGFAIAIAISNFPIAVNERVKNLVAAIALLMVLTFMSLRWGSRLVAVCGLGDQPRAARIGGLSFALALFAAVLILPAGEVLFETGIPIHAIYGMLFVPAAFLVVSSTAMAFGRTLRDWRLGRSLAVRAAPPAALAFLLIYLLLDGIGYRVGGPGAAERATMITVTFIGSLGAAAAGGAGLGIGLQRFSRKP